MRAWPDTALAPSPPALLDGDSKQVGQPPLRVSPCRCTQLAKHLVLSARPQRPRGLQGFSPFRCECHRLDAPVGVRNTLDHTIPLQEVEAPCERRLVDGQHVLELPQVRRAQTRDGAENAELSHPQTARPQDVVVQLCHGPARHAERAADTRGQPCAVRSVRRPRASSVHGVMLLVVSPPHKQIICSYILLHPSTFDSRIRLAPTDLTRGRGAGATLTGDRPNTKGKRPGEEMTRTNAVVIALATELAATRADAARLPFEIPAPRNQDAADGQGCTENTTSLETVPAS